MPEVNTEEQALALLARMHPDTTYRAYPFESGWICLEEIPPQEMLTRGLGLASLIVDKDTGIVTVQSSLPMDVVAQQYAEAKRTGAPTPGMQVYPPRWRIALLRTREDDTAIEYDMTATSLTDPPEPSRRHPLVIEKATLRHEPTDRLSATAMAHAEWTSRNHDGIWPEADTLED